MDQIEQQPEKRDVSRQTLVVLVVLAVVVSLLGTFTVLRETSGAQQIKVLDKSTPTAQGTVSLEIAPAPQPVAATGHVTFNIVR